jgi:Methyltransferase domain
MKQLLLRVQRRALSPLLTRLDDVNLKLADVTSELNELRLNRDSSEERQKEEQPESETDFNYPERYFPTLEPRHLPGARLFANRNDLISCLTSARGGVVAEIGVANGDFSQILLNELQPSQFFALDTFELHLIPMIWGIPTEELLQGKSHLEFYRNRFSSLGDRVVIKQGLSDESLETLPDHYFDLIYIDAGHDYDHVRRDADLSRLKLKDDGILVFNDYIMFDHIRRVPYGVVQAVNEMVVNEGWRVIGLALHHDLFCDIAIVRSTSDTKC